MLKINVQTAYVGDKGYGFIVVVEEDDEKTTHKVTLEKGYLLQLTKDESKKEELIKQAFVFLLRNEPKESILEKFDLPKIQEYFEKFEPTMKSFFGVS